MKRNIKTIFVSLTNDMVKCRRGQQEKMMDFDYREEYSKGVYQTKYYYGSVKKGTFSFSSNLQIDKKISSVKEDPRRKTDSNLDFSQLLHFLVLMRFYLEGMLRSAYHRTLFTPKEAEIGR